MTTDSSVQSVKSTHSLQKSMPPSQILTSTLQKSASHSNGPAPPPQRPAPPPQRPAPPPQRPAPPPQRPAPPPQRPAPPPQRPAPSPGAVSPSLKTQRRLSVSDCITLAQYSTSNDQPFHVLINS